MIFPPLSEYKLDPTFRKKDGCICLFDSEDAKKVKAEKRPWTRALSSDEVKESAREAVEHKGGGIPTTRSMFLASINYSLGPSGIKHLNGWLRTLWGMLAMWWHPCRWSQVALIQTTI